MTLVERVHAPSFTGATEWLNSEPLGLADLRSDLRALNLLAARPVPILERADVWMNSRRSPVAGRIEGPGAVPGEPHQPEGPSRAVASIDRAMTSVGRANNRITGADPGRRWYDLRPEPQHRADFLGWWMALGWPIVLPLIVWLTPGGGSGQ